jgi:hypothetical protein
VREYGNGRDAISAVVLEAIYQRGYFIALHQGGIEGHEKRGSFSCGGSKPFLVLLSRKNGGHPVVQIAYKSVRSSGKD